MMLHIFSYAYLTSLYLLWWDVYSDHLSILKIQLLILLLSFKSSLYTLGNSLLQIFSPNLWIIFFLLILSFIEHKFLILTKSSLLFLSWMVPSFHWMLPYQKIHHHNHRQLGCLICYLLDVPLVLHSIIRSKIHFGLIFVKGVNSVSHFFFFWCMDVQLS